MKSLKIIILAYVVGLSSSLALAHHAPSMFDLEKEETLTAVVKEFQFTNPHAWLIVTVADGDEETTNWSIEFGAPTLLRKRGVSKRTFLPGQEVIVTIHPMKDGRPAGGLVSLTNADGSPAY